MKTTFKWTDKQRLTVIRGISLGITLSKSLEGAMNLGMDAFLVSAGTPEMINSDKYFQERLKFVLEHTDSDLYNRLMEDEDSSDEESMSFSA